MPAPRVMRLLQGYYWDKRNHNYVRAASGRFVARSRILELLEKSVAGRERRLYEGVQRLVDGRRSPQVFLSHAKLMLKRQYLQEAALAAGGWDRLTPADFGRVGGKLQAQYRRMAEMTRGIRDGEVANMGWQPAGVLPIPTQGSVCNGNCHCTLHRVEVDTARAQAVIGTRGRP